MSILRDKTKMRRAIVISDLGEGGAQRVLVRLARDWLDAGVEITVITLSGAECDQVVLPQGVQRIALDCMSDSAGVFSAVTSNLRRVRLLRRAIIASKASEVVSFIAGVNILAILACHRLGVRVVISERNDPSRQPLGRMWEFLRRRLYKNADIVTANSRQALKSLAAYVPQDKLYFVPNSMPDWRDEPQPQEKRQKIILAVGRLHAQKGYERLLHIFAASTARTRGWQLVILGEGGERRRLEELSKELGISKTVSMPGHSKDVRSWYDKASVFTMMSYYEGTPNAVIEAISRALPVLVSETCGDAVELITQLECGYAIDADDFGSSAQILDDLTSDTALRNALGCRGREGASQFFSTNAVRTHWEKALSHSFSSLPVFYVIGSLSTGGAERHVANVAMELARRGHDVSIFCLLRGGALEREVQASGVKALGIPVRKDPSQLSRPVRILVLVLTVPWLFILFFFIRPSMVHFFLPEAYLAGGMMARAAGLSRLIMSRRSLNNYQQKRPGVAALELKLHGAMTAVLGNSRRVVEQLEEEGIAPVRLGLIYNGIDVDRFDREGSGDRHDIRRALGLRDKTTVITIVANLIPYKGHQDLLDALALVRDEMPADWVLLIIGRDDGIGRDLADRAKAHGLAEHVQFLGLRSDIARLLPVSDIGVLCSHEEGFSNALLEGMAAALPMVVTDAGGNGEAVVDGVTGLIVPIKNPKILGQAILQLTRDKDLAHKLGLAGRKRVEQQFSFAACVNHYENLYTALMQGKAITDVLDVGLERRS